MRLNLGCGRNRIDGCLNVDASPICEPDLLWDLEETPWPWPDNSAEEVLFIHSLEHMGADPKVFVRIIQELYRVCAPDALVRINVPHPRHDDFLGDPTHVRPILPATLRLFDRELNEAWIASGLANSPLALYAGVDFRVEKTDFVLAEPYYSKFRSGEVSAAEIAALTTERNNIVREIRITMRARKG